MKKIEITNEMVDAELAREDAEIDRLRNAPAGQVAASNSVRTSLSPRVRTDVTFGRVFMAVLLANVCTGIIGFLVFTIIAANS